MRGPPPDSRESSGTLSVAVVVPVWNGRRWLDGLLASLDAQTRAPDELVFVDNGSTDGSVEMLRARGIEPIELGRNTGFAHACNRGIETARSEAVALVNTDVELEPDWLERMVARLEGGGEDLAAVACKMVDLADPRTIYDAGDVLRRDGVCEQRGRFGADDGRFDEPGEVFGACAGAAVYRRSAVLEAGGFDERFFAYLEDVDLALRLRLRGGRCAYEPAVARHAGGGSGGEATRLAARNTLLLVVRAFPLRWAPYVIHRQLGALRAALRRGDARAHVRGLLGATPLLPAMLRERRALRALPVPVEVAVPWRPWRGPRAAGHPRAAA